tara:strand:+ start:14608 stop:15855 length:1248 start_codon:yes stop_codon:yes gene_type:complete
MLASLSSGGKATNQTNFQKGLTPIITLFMCILIMLFNPMIVIILGALLELRGPLSKVLNYIIALSLALSISNRSVGQMWFGAGGQKANDDAINYLDWYHQIEGASYVADLGSYFTKLLSGQEPLWFFMAEIVGVLSDYDQNLLVFFSVATPLILIHYSFQKLSPYFFTIALLFYALIPEIFHSLYHLWRFVLSASIVYCIFAISLTQQRIRLSYLIWPVLAHSSGLISALIFALARFNFFNAESGFIYRICYVFTALATIILAVILGMNFLQFIGFSKILYYAESVDMGAFSYSLRHVLYAGISVGLLLKSNSRLIILFSLMNLVILSGPLFFPQIGLILDRILIAVSPIIVLALAFYIKDRLFYRVVIVLPLIIFYLWFASKADGTLFYQYMGNGEFFSPMSGVFYNLYSRNYL